jgi:hypothetical protein
VIVFVYNELWKQIELYVFIVYFSLFGTVTESFTKPLGSRLVGHGHCICKKFQSVFQNGNTLQIIQRMDG